MYNHLARKGFPTVKQLRRGILLGCIAHSLWLAANEGIFRYNQFWDGDTYVDENDQGERWAVAFDMKGAVAVFYSSESERNPFPKGSPPYHQNRYFRGMPRMLLKAKKRALSWMNTLHWEKGGPAVITSAMWADGKRFTANEPWKAVFYNSLWACHRQLVPFDVALLEWLDYCSLDDRHIPVLCSLYQRRIATTEESIPVDPWERKALLRSVKKANAKRRKDDPGLLAARDVLTSVGIALAIE
jgi:hypothetical protein